METTRAPRTLKKLRKLDGRVTALEANLKKKDVWDIISTLSPFVTAIVIFIATFVLKDSVDQALSKEQLHLSSVKDMEEQVLALRKTNVTKDEAEAAAMTLAAFGHYAIPSLTSVLERADDVQSPAAEEGLRAIGETEPAEVCHSMIHILQDPSASYVFQTHEAALRLIAASRCAEARPVVAAYKSELDNAAPADLSKISARFRQTIQRDNLADLKKQVDVTLGVLTTAGT